MAAKTGIAWTDATWTPVRARVKTDAADIARTKGYTSLVQIAEKMAGRVGPHCEHASPECDHCYSEAGNGRCLPSNGTGLPFDRRARDLIDAIIDEKILEQPLHWRRGRRIFVCSQTDLFGEWVPDEYIDRVFAVMALCPQHTFQVLTKRPRRMREYLTRGVDDEFMRDVIDNAVQEFGACHANMNPPERWPLPNVWLGVTAGDQQRADERIPDLLGTPAAKRFVSAEPMLGPVDLTAVRYTEEDAECRWNALTAEHWVDNSLSAAAYCCEDDGVTKLDWVICGGESGHGARPMHPDWARSLRDQCQAAGVPFFFKQWGEHAPYEPDGELIGMERIGKKKAGRLLDGQEWSQFPEANNAR